MQTIHRKISKKIRAILDEQRDILHNATKPEVYIINNNSENMYTFQLTSCSPQYILVYSGYINAYAKNEASLNILLTHELMHLKNDFPYMSFKRLTHLSYFANLLFLFFVYMPMQIGFSIAGSATTDFQPAFVYLPIIGVALTLFTTLNILQEARTRERNADYCALFNGKKFEKAEYEKHKKFCANHSENESYLTRLFDTHPHGSERIALAEAAEVAQLAPALNATI
jgi:Zn-dependent protease with chaperone function